MIWRLIYQSETGFVNPLFTSLGLGAPNVPRMRLGVLGLVLVDVEWTPLLFLICLAGLQSIPQEPLEPRRWTRQARSGCSSTTRCRCCCRFWPSVSVLRLIDAVGTFDQIFVLTRGGPGTATQLISVYAYNAAFNFTDYGHGAAMLIALLAFAFLLVLVALSLMRRPARGGHAGGPVRAVGGDRPGDLRFPGPVSCGCCGLAEAAGGHLGGPSLPKPPTLSNYTALFTQYHFGAYLVNSILIVARRCWPAC